MLQLMRNKTFILIVIGIALIGFTATLFISGQGSGQTVTLGTIDKDKISARNFEETMDRVRNQMYGDRELTAQEQGALPRTAWETLVYETIFFKTLKEMNLTASDAAVVEYMLKNPHPMMAQAPIFQTNGQFDLQKYQSIISSPGFYENPQNESYLVQVETETKTRIWPGTMLQALLVAGKTPSKSEIAYAYKTLNSRVKYEYVTVLPGSISVEPQDVSKEQVQSYFDKNVKKFTKDESQASLYIVRFPTTPDNSDRDSLLVYLTSLRDSIVNNDSVSFVDFTWESDDEKLAQNDGELGWVPRGFSNQFAQNPMVYAAYKTMEDLAFSLPVGGVSTPFEMGPTLSLISVDSVKMVGDSVAEVKLRQIVKNVVATDSKVEKLSAGAEKLSQEAQGKNLISVATAKGYPVDSTELFEKGALVPVVAYANGLGKFIFDFENNVGTVSEVFENEEGFFVVAIRSRIESGKTPLLLVEKEIRRKIADSLSVEKQKEFLEKAMASFDGKSSLTEFAAKNPKLMANVTELVTTEQYVPGIGNGAVATELALSTPTQSSSKVVKGEYGVFMVRPLEKSLKDPKVMSQDEALQVAQRLRMMALYTPQNYRDNGSSKAFDEWHAAKKLAAGIKSKVSQFYY